MTHNALDNRLLLRLDRIFNAVQENTLSELVALRDEIMRISGDMRTNANRKAVKKLLKKHKAERIISTAVAVAGASASAAIIAALSGVWADGVKTATDELCKEAGSELAFPRISASAALHDMETRFERQSHKRLASRTLAVTRYKSAVKKATERVHSSADFLPLLVAVAFGYTSVHARTLYRTQRTHVHGYAVYSIGKAAAALGLRLCKQWHCRMLPTSRDPHELRNGLCAPIDAHFPGSNMLYPGDPEGGPGEVCNCVCYMSLHILGKNDRIVDGHLIRGG